MRFSGSFAFSCARETQLVLQHVTRGSAHAVMMHDSYFWPWEADVYSKQEIRCVALTSARYRTTHQAGTSTSTALCKCVLDMSDATVYGALHSCLTRCVSFVVPVAVESCFVGSFGSRVGALVRWPGL